MTRFPRAYASRDCDGCIDRVRDACAVAFHRWRARCHCRTQPRDLSCRRQGGAAGIAVGMQPYVATVEVLKC